MTQFPLYDLANQFRHDVKGISDKFEERVEDASRGLKMQVAELMEAGQLPHSASPRSTSASVVRNDQKSASGGRVGRGSGSGRGSGGGRGSRGRSSHSSHRRSSGEPRPPLVEESPLKRAKLGAEVSSEAARNAAARTAAGSPARPADQLVAGITSPARVVPMSCSPSSVTSAIKAVCKTISDKVRGAPTPATASSANLEVGRLFSASPKPGSLLDAMRGRGTLRGGNLPATSSPSLGGPPPQLVAAPVPAITPPTMSSESSSAIAAFKATVSKSMVPGQAKGVNIATAKKFRRSSMARLAVQEAANIKGKTSVQANKKRKISSMQGKVDQPAVAGTPLQSPAKARPRGREKQAAKKSRPPVPSFSGNVEPPSSPPKEAWQLLRQVDLSPKKDEDNYEISDRDENSDDQGGEIIDEPDRSHKHVPQWSVNFLETLSKQEHMDPDSIFGSKVPFCDLDLIFTDQLYKQFSQDRPKRKRGSSAVWSKDRLCREEIEMYKQKMGHNVAWNARDRNAAGTCSSNNSAGSA
mmetsp:Transcript_41678/g.73163  ORF Transcript_41678/g.73163 Transcript_41678/m.73163 type:complete len:526 (-) Transcript_41678:142-1719(-)